MERSEKVIFIVNLVVMLFFTFNWVLVYALGNFFILVLPGLLAIVVFFIICLFAFVHAIRWIEKKGLRSLNALLFCAVTGLAVIFGMPRQMGRWCDFWALLLPRESVIHQIRDGTLPVKLHGSHLSGWKRFISMDGEVEAQGKGKELKVLFIDAEGFLSDFSGFIYCSGDEPPLEGDFTMVNTVTQKLAHHWYYMESHN